MLTGPLDSDANAPPSSPAAGWVERWPLGIRLMWQLVAAFVIFSFLPLYAYDICPTEPSALRDFFQEWSSAMNYYTGRPIYQRLQESLNNYEIFKPGEGDGYILEYNAHPPVTVLLALPFVAPHEANFAGYRNALWRWNLVSLILFAAAIGLTCWELQLTLSRWLVLPALAALLFYNPFHTQLSMGQWNSVLLFLLTVIWWSDRRGIPVVPGLLIALVTAIKVFPGLLLLWLLLRRRWTELAIALVSLIGLGLLTLSWFGWQTYTDYFQLVLPSLAKYYPAWINFSLTGLWTKLFVGSELCRVTPLVAAPGLANALILITSSGLILGWAYQLWRAQGRVAHDLAFGMAVTLMLIVSPVTWDYSLLMMCLPICILLRQAQWTPLTWWLFLACWATWWYHTYEAAMRWQRWTGVPLEGTPLLVIFLLSLPLYGLLGMYGLLWHEMQMQRDLRRPRDSSGTLVEDSAGGVEI